MKDNRRRKTGGRAARCAGARGARRAAAGRWLKNEELGTKNEEAASSSFFSSSFLVGSWLAVDWRLRPRCCWWPSGWACTRARDLSEQFVLDEAIRSFDMGVDQPGPLLAEKPAPADYPFSHAVLQVRGTRWRPLEAFLGRRGVVYDLPGPAGTTAALYVVDAEAVDGFGTAPALHPFTTAGCCASSWQEGGLLYVLVVQGDPATYRAYLNLPVHSGPVA